MQKFGVVHVPLTVRVQQNRRNPEHVISFIGTQLCFFERDIPSPQIGETVEVMITRALYSTFPEGHPNAGSINNNSIRSLMIRAVDPALHALVAINGFETSGTMCRTTAQGGLTDGRRVLTAADIYTRSTYDRMSMWLTPGRSGIRDVSNVNLDHNQFPPKPRVPTNVFVSRQEYEEKAGSGVRVLGLTRVIDGRWAHLVRR